MDVQGVQRELDLAIQRQAIAARAWQQEDDLRISTDALRTALEARREAADQVAQEELAIHRRAAVTRTKQQAEDQRTSADVVETPWRLNARLRNKQQWKPVSGIPRRAYRAELLPRRPQQQTSTEQFSAARQALD